MFQSNIPLAIVCPSTTYGRKKQASEEICLVCGGQSIGINFGIQTCSPCKAFFRRNAVKLGTHEFICSKDGDCPINGYTRRLCNCCRLAKCFRVGMNRNSIRTEEQKLERKQLVEYNRKKRAETNTTIQPVNLLKSSHNTYSSLSSQDQTLLANIFNAYEKTCISLSYNEHIKIPDNTSFSLEKMMNSLSHMYIAIIEYIKFVPEFTNLSNNTKFSLMKTNFNQIFRLNTPLVIHATGVVSDVNTLAVKHAFPPDLYQELCQCAMDLFPFVYDPIYLKLIFIVLIFSTSLNLRYDRNQEIIYTKHILSIQNFYIELLWRYILHRCSSYQQSVRLLTSFITRLLHSQIINEKLAELVNKISPNQVDQLEPIMKSMWINNEK